MSWKRIGMLGLAAGLVMLGALQGAAWAQDGEPGEPGDTGDDPGRCSGLFPADPDCLPPPGTNLPDPGEGVPAGFVEFVGDGGRDGRLGDGRRLGEGAVATEVVHQEGKQEAESGDVEQSFEVTGGGDNSNLCVGVEGAANTGNAQNQTGVVQYGSEGDDFEFDDVGSSVEVSPSNSTTCDQQVNQAAAASGP